MLVATLLVSLLAVTPSVADDRPPLDEGVLAWTVARGWLDRLEVPRAQEAEASVPLREAHGVSILVRLNGRLIGRGEHVGRDGLALRTAMADALADIFANANLTETLEIDAMHPGRRLTLELELAGEPIPLLGGTFHEISARLEPGIDGLAMRRGNEIAMMFPGAMLATNLAGRPATAFGSLSTELGLGLRDLQELRRSERVEVYRMGVRRLVQPTEGAAPIEPIRNAQLVVLRGVTADRAVETLEAMIGRAGQHRFTGTLDRAGAARPSRLAPRLSLFRGDYRPSVDQMRDPLADTFEQALMSFALLRASEVVLAERVARDAWSMAKSTLESVCRGAVDSVEGVAVGDAEAIGDERSWIDQLDPRTVAALLLAFHALDASSRVAGDEAAANAALQFAETRRDLLERLRSTVSDDGSVTVVDDRGAGQRVSGHDQAIVAAALAISATSARPASDSRADPDPVSRGDIELAMLATESAWESVPVGLHPSLLPWIVLAERELLDRGVERSLEPILRLREAIFAAQVGFNDLDFAPDLHGGLALVGAAVTPTAQGLRPMFATAMLLGDERFTPELVRPPLWTRQLAMTRFLMQLLVTPPMDGLHRNAARVRYGVRASMWDSDQPVAAQAMGLLALAETLRVWPADEGSEPLEAP